MHLQTIATLAETICLLLPGVVKAAVAGSRSASKPYPCDMYQNKTIYCQNFTANYDNLHLNDTVSAYDYLIYSNLFEPGSPWHVGRSAGLLQPAIIPHSGHHFIYTQYDTDTTNLVISGTNNIPESGSLRDGFFSLPNVTSFYFACAKQGTQHAVPCTVTFDADVTEGKGKASFDFEPRTVFGKTPMQFASLSHIDPYPGSFVLKAYGTSDKPDETDISLFLDDFKYKIASAPYSYFYD